MCKIKDDVIKEKINDDITVYNDIVHNFYAKRSKRQTILGAEYFPLPSVAEPEPPFLGRVRSRCRSRFFLSVRAESRSRLFKAAPAVSCSKSLVLALSTGMNSVEYIK